jgi:predicted nucleic acid-binding protein
MIVIDTNVISEVMKQNPARSVVTWLRFQPALAVFTTTVTVAEVLTGIRLLPAGKRRDELLAGANEMFDRVLRDRILSFDRVAAEAYAEVTALRRRMGVPIRELDAQIAAITLANRMKLATRDVGDFAGCGVELIDPWRT